MGLHSTTPSPRDGRRPGGWKNPSSRRRDGPNTIGSTSGTAPPISSGVDAGPCRGGERPSAAPGPPPALRPRLAGPNAAVKPSTHIPSLDGLRAIAIALVFLSHAGLRDVVPGTFGVTVFFFLSGYLITTLLRREWARAGRIRFRQFYLRRAVRIFPPLYLSLACASVVTLVGL